MRNYLILTLLVLFASSSVHSANTIELDLDSAAGKAAIANGPIQMQVGQNLRVVVDENPTTGYVWIINQATNGPFKIIVDKYVSEASTSGGPVFGAGGNRIIELQATTVGSGDL